jgi:hypothetical protein
LWGGLGIVLGAVALLLALALIVDWFASNLWLGRLAPFAAFAMLAIGIMAVTIFSFGIMFSYLIAIFTHKPVRRGMFGRIIFDPPLDYSFGRVGLATAGAGLMLSLIVLVIVWLGTPLGELWLWLLLSALLVVVGAQLCMAYLMIRVLEELTRRAASTQRDLVDTAAVVELTLPEVTIPIEAAVSTT